MAKDTKITENPANTIPQNQPNVLQEETLEQKVVRLEAEKIEALKGLATAKAERDAANELAVESSDKLKKFESVKTEPTIDFGKNTFKILLNKFALKIKGSGTAIKFQLIKNADGTVDNEHIYPNDEQLKEISEAKGILIKL